ncbi:hypothetical protein [Streptomyces sp. BPTC-684]|uniref:hypothetical protein n=1 Tax=Streptomyces sp. BPTC-684 TaxID=3043734 RepID=UPI0024B10C06|nr:hypothetical protein [Streptomyces sp. BPTC-684]WHM36291.1 hypothetical protein QIY60_04675 [Streptomyces sp. BPTC-684]
MTVSLSGAARLLGEPTPPPVPGQLTLNEPALAVPAGLAEAFAARTRPSDDGHREWAAGTTTQGVGRFQYNGVAYTSHQAAFVLRTGRHPVGTVRPVCERPRCCEPEHVDDQATRQRDRAALAAVKGMIHRAPSCDHDQAVHGRHRADGRRYCNACNNARTEPSCEHGNPACGARAVRPYPCGPRCEEHQPSRTRPFYPAP